MKSSVGADTTAFPMIAEGAWFVVDLEPTDPFVDDPDRLWRNVLRRQRGRLALFSNYPEDATVN